MLQIPDEQSFAIHGYGYGFGFGFGFALLTVPILFSFYSLLPINHLPLFSSLLITHFPSFYDLGNPHI
ncbi:hypothetical protein Fmac_011718 [Flemingia macrophylla]|uniref:Uncharacterized protein n=1 Tax=Flemingia macrophylla TaxID=520843 RepID=A0ABD1MN97_9FABA